MTEYRKTSDYEEMAATFQVMMLHWLNSALEEAGIADKEQRKKICWDFGFSFSIWKDQYSFKTPEGHTVYPCISFATNGPVTNMDLDDLGVVYLPSQLFSFKDYLGGDLDYLFDEESDEEISEQIETGLE